MLRGRPSVQEHPRECLPKCHATFCSLLTSELSRARRASALERRVRRVQPDYAIDYKARLASLIQCPRLGIRRLRGEVSVLRDGNLTISAKHCVDDRGTEER